MVREDCYTSTATNCYATAQSQNGTALIFLRFSREGKGGAA